MSLRSLRWVAACIFCAFLLGSFESAPRSAAQGGGGGVSDARFARLAKGVNLPFWFWMGPAEAKQLETRFTDEEFAALRAMGLTHVRLPIDWSFIADESAVDLLHADHLAALDRAIERLFAADLAVIIDLHAVPTPQAGQYSGALENDPKFLATFKRFWLSFAKHLSRFDPERLFLAAMNEPTFQQDPSRWAAMQPEIVATLREGAPDHTLIATGALWSSLETLLRLTPLADPNVIYEFHFYDPFAFTHQGATWIGENPVTRLREVPFPPNETAMTRLYNRKRNDPDALRAAQAYAEENWTPERITKRLAEAGAWAKKYGVRVICTEFGVYSEYAPPQDRANWHGAVVKALEGQGIGWTMWEYDRSFGLVTRYGKKVEVNRPLAEAMGLTLP
ncbi:MAG TPA: cellulase family glycosylhydrolase [Aggregatilineales bacterium]|nr:cellulase family glycosylhydrolase [Anaerolineales bacterium]HRE46130.1 cellulase family glycosylhydrolase [Aggregatilineales bacterium]